MSDLASLILTSRGFYDEVISRQQREILELKTDIEHHKRMHRKNLESIYEFNLDSKYALTAGPLHFYAYSHPEHCMSCLKNLYLHLGRRTSYKLILKSTDPAIKTLHMCYDCSNYVLQFVDTILSPVYIIDGNQYKCLSHI